MSTRVLLDEDWFFGTWAAAVEMFVSAARTPVNAASDEKSVEEVSIAGLDSLMSLLKTASPAALAIIVSRKTESEISGMKSKKVRELLWQSAWKAVEDVAAYDENFFDEFPLKFIQMLTDYYASENANGNESLFSGGQGNFFLKAFLETVVLIARPRKRSKPIAKLSELQLSRSTMTLLKQTIPQNITAFLYLVATLAEFAFSSGISAIVCPFRKFDIILEPVNSALRCEMGRYLCAVISFDEENSFDIPDANIVAVQTAVLYTSDDSNDIIKLACLDIVSRRFILDICQSALQARNSTYLPIASLDLGRPSLQRQNSLEMLGGILSAVGNILSTPSNGLDEAESIDLEVIGKPLHQFKALATPSTVEKGCWRAFHATSSDIDILLFATKAVLPAYTQSGQSMFKPIVWSSLLVCALCMGSPWTTAEIVPDSVNVASLEEADKVNDQIKEFLLYMTEMVIEPKLPSSATSTLIEVLCTLVAMILSKLEMLEEESSIRLQLGILNTCFDTLIQISQSLGAPLISRRSAIGGVIRIVEDLVDIIFRRRNQAPLSEYTQRECEKFLVKLCDLKCTVDMLPSENESRYSWESCCAHLAALYAEDWSTHLLRRHSFKSNDEISLVLNNHIILLIPVAVRILKSETGDGFIDVGLRQAAALLLESLDPVTLISSLKSFHMKLKESDTAKDLQRELEYMQV